MGLDLTQGPFGLTNLSPFTISRVDTGSMLPLTFRPLTWLRNLCLASLCGMGVLLQGQVITASANPNFGKVLEDFSAGTVSLSPLGTRTPTGGATLFGGTVSAMTFTVSGVPTDTYTIMGFPPSLTLTGPGGNVIVEIADDRFSELAFGLHRMKRT